MSKCGAQGCGSDTEEFKCGRCQGVFYCNATCQKADWRRHKPYCKPLPSSAASSAASTRRPLRMRRGRVSTNPVDDDLFDVVHSYLERTRASPPGLARELTSVMQIAQTLVSRGARPDTLTGLCYDHPGRVSVLSSLCSLGSSGMEPLLELLLTADCNPALDANASDDHDDGTILSILHICVVLYRPSFLRLLIAHGADVRGPSAGGTGDLMWPVFAFVVRLVSDLTSDRPNPTMDGALETLDCLLAAGVDVDASEGYLADGVLTTGFTPLLMLLRGWQMHDNHPGLRKAVTMRLIDAGTDLTARSPLQMRPLDLAAELPSLDIFKALIAKGADASPVPYIVVLPPQSGAGAEPGEREQVSTHYLQTAIERGRADVLQAAADAGVNLKKVKALGVIAAPLLALAVMRRQLECVRFLLEYGCDVNQVYEAGGRKHTAVDATAALDSTDDSCGIRHQVAAVLRAAGGNCFDDLSQAGAGDSALPA